MGTVREEFREEMKKELAYYTSFIHPVRTLYLERALRWKTRIKKLHPNPEDEFVNPEIGPNPEIVKKYQNIVIDCNKMGVKPRFGLLIVEKLSTGDFMILNGHHRWYAAKSLNAKKISIQIVNTVHENDILSRLKNLSSSMCVSFDLDEVLVCADGSGEVDVLRPPLNRLYPLAIRKDTGLMISELRRIGLDVWVYTGNYYDTEYIQKTLKAHKCKADGIINGMNLARGNQKVANAFRKKYRYIVHVDTERILWVNTETKEYDTLEIPQDGNWADHVTGMIRRKVDESKT